VVEEKDKHKEDEHNKDFDLDISIFEGKDESSEFAKKLKDNKEKATVAFKGFIHNIGTEAKETKEASKVVVKFLKEGKVTKEEEKELKTQVYDLLKMMGIGVPFFLIPGSTLLLPFLIKLADKKGISLLPSAFNKKEESEDSENKDQ
jgi:hypothetical protein